MLGNGSRQLDATCGSRVWDLNRFREDILKSLFNDLAALERVGLEYGDCLAVKSALSKMIQAAEPVDQELLWKRSLANHFQKLLVLYERWNDHEGEDPQIVTARAKALKKLREWREKFSRKVGRYQYELFDANNAQLADAIYDAVGALSSRYPNLFPRLAATLRNLGRTKSNYTVG
jgi:hypothetical protein